MFTMLLASSHLQVGRAEFDMLTGTVTSLSGSVTSSRGILTSLSARLTVLEENQGVMIDYVNALQYLMHGNICKRQTMSLGAKE